MAPKPNTKGAEQRPAQPRYRCLRTFGSPTEGKTYEQGRVYDETPLLKRLAESRTGQVERVQQ